MASPRLRCARLLLVIVAFLPICRCYPSADDAMNLKDYSCAKAGASLGGGLTIPMDNQLRIDPLELNDEAHVRFLQLNENASLVYTFVGKAGFCVIDKFVLNGPCHVATEQDVGPNHEPNECPECTSLTVTCHLNEDTRVFRMNLDQFKLYQHCNGRVYIDDIRVLLELNDVNGEKCPTDTKNPNPASPTDAETPRSAKRTDSKTTQSTETETTQSSTKTETTQSTKTEGLKVWVVMLIILGAILIIAAVSVQLMLIMLWRRRQPASRDASEWEEEYKPSARKSKSKESGSQVKAPT